MRENCLRTVGRGGAVVLLAGAVAGCGLAGKLAESGHGDPKDEEAKEEEAAGKQKQAPVRLVGEIASVHAEEGFVLIRRHAQGRIEAGGLLSTLSPAGGTASLRFTGEMLGRYYAADLQDGSPKVGDLVIARSLPEGSEAPSTPVPEVPRSGGSAPWLQDFSPR